MMAYEWQTVANDLRAAGLDGLADFYATNARRVSRGEPAIWPIPADLRISNRLAEGKADPAPFASDSREPDAHDGSAPGGRP